MTGQPIVNDRPARPPLRSRRHPRRRGARWAAAVVTTVLPLAGILAWVPVAAVAADTPAVPSATARTIAAGGSPASVAIDQATHTAYVGNGNDGTVSVINTATCNADVRRGCHQTAPTIKVGKGPVDDVVDQATDTVYVVDAFAGKTISVIDGATCNATVHSGCDQIPATVAVGGYPQGVAVDQATDTVYVTNIGPNGDNSIHSVSVINGATCNGRVHTGCAQTPAAVQVGLAPGVPAVDEATDTVYVPNAIPTSAGSVSVIDGKTCNGRVHTGCGRTPPTLAGGANSNAVAVDEATDTVYGTSAGPGLGTVYVLNGATCNARVTSGCGQRPASVPVGSGPNDLLVDPVANRVFVTNQEDSTVSVIDGNTCNAHHTAGCSRRAPVLTTGFETGYLDIDLATHTVYVTSQLLNDVWVLDADSCTSTHPSGCRHDAPTSTVGNGPNGIAVNPVTHTVYVANQDDSTVSVINSAICSVRTSSGCGRTWPTVAVGNFPQAVAVDPRTDTVYVANVGGHSVSVIDGAACNATDHAGCASPPATVAVGRYPDDLTVDAATDTVYVADAGDNTVSVIDGMTCNATTTTGCSHTPPTAAVGKDPYGIAVNARTDTVYVADDGDNTLSVIDGTTCRAGFTSGCGRTPPTVAAGESPGVLAVNPVTDTVYVADQGIDNPYDGPETLTSLVSVINGATCDAATTTGCGQSPATLVTGGDPQEGIAVDPAHDTVWVDSLVNSDMSVFHGATCDGTHHSGCGQTPLRILMGGWPGGMAFDETAGTVYAADNVDGQVSILSARGCRSR